jgi:hypothetical protein
MKIRIKIKANNIMKLMKIYLYPTIEFLEIRIEINIRFDY